jgi:cytochrome c-type biogenesis protein CcmH
MLVVLVTLPAEVLAQGGKVTPNDVNRIAKQLYCPVCPNTPLDVCETKACEDWRELIRQKLEAGESDREIIDYFVAQYGERVLATPPPRGFNLVGYTVPPLLLLAGVAFLAFVLRAWTRRPAPFAATDKPGPSIDELPAEYVERLERQLEDYQ